MKGTNIVTSVYQIVTDNIINLLEQGVIPWQQPYRDVGGRWPVNARNIRYRGINVFILHTTKMMKGYTSNFWVTYKQAQAMNGTVKKGEKGTTIVFWKVGAPIREFDEATQRTVTRRPFMLRYYTVFNLDQTENVDLTRAMKMEQDEMDSELVYNPPIDEAEAIVATYFARDDAPKLVERAMSDAPYYIPSMDEIHVPLRGQANSPEDWYYILNHEIAHSTGHASRLNRKGIGEFSHGSYGKEELVAEMTNAFLCAESGIANRETDRNNAAYIQSWLTQLRADNTLVIQAASAAQKALDYILGVEYNQVTEEE